MKKYFNIFIIFGMISFILFLLLLILLNVDKSATLTGEVGLSHLNNLIQYKYNKTWQIVGNIFLYIGIALFILLVGLGIYQLIKRKSLFSVDKYILTIGVFFIVLVLFWLLFDKLVVINNRPILVDEKMEPSFPSTHTLLVVFIYLSAYTVVINLTNNKMYQNIVLCLAITISLIVSISRVLAGMHYITDVLGGILLGLALFFLSFGLSLNNKKIEE